MVEGKIEMATEMEMGLVGEQICFLLKKQNTSHVLKIDSISAFDWMT